MLKYLIVFLISVCFSCASLLSNIVSEAEILEKLEFNQDKITSFRGMADIDFSLAQKKGAVEILVVADKTGNLRIETGNFFGVPLSALTIHRDELSYYIIPEEKIYIGKPANEFSSQVLPLGIDAEDLKGLLFFTKKSYLDFKKRNIFKLEIFAFQHDEKQNLYYPSGLKLSNQKTKEYVEIRWQAKDLNPKAFPKELFEMERPPQARIIEWSKRYPSPLLQGNE